MSILFLFLVNFKLSKFIVRKSKFKIFIFFKHSINKIYLPKNNLSDKREKRKKI